MRGGVNGRWWVVVAGVVAGGCHLLTPIQHTVDSSFSATYKPSPYNGWALIHTRLDVTPQWKEHQIEGVATLTLKPIFYPMDTLVLDAKRLRIDSILVHSKETNSWQPVSNWHFEEDSMRLVVPLEYIYTRRDTLQIRIYYWAKGQTGYSEGRIPAQGGFFFINAEGQDPHIPMNAWTQGQTEWNSTWYPTIDKPNQKTTQEVCITVDTSLTTISNGVLWFSITHADGRRTDCWTLTQPHAPYLTCVVVGLFSVMRDTSEVFRVPVENYVLKGWERQAKHNFRHTPEMIDFYSRLLDYPYPWGIYKQVAVHGFTAGAMENTTITLHGAHIYITPQEERENSREYIIAHELFHHWFGDLVTCESWANLPLNESFADYGEYLWAEYKHGRNEADWYLYQTLRGYLSSDPAKYRPLIHYYYSDAGEMFDVHSYNKGGAILNMLRRWVGDSVFFAALSHYLTERAFKAAEVHHLRLAFEEVTGQDFNWFFNDWFLREGHPSVDATFWTEGKHLYVAVRQRSPHQEKVPIRIKKVGKSHRHPTQKQDEFRPFHIPVHVGVAVGDTLLVVPFLFSLLEDTFSVLLPDTPVRWAVFDYNSALVGTLTEHKPLAWWRRQLVEAPLAMLRLRVLQQLGQGMVCEVVSGTQKEARELWQEFVSDALNDSIWYVRHRALELSALSSVKCMRMGEERRPLFLRLISVAFSDTVEFRSLREKVKWLAEQDPHWQVRAQAVGVSAGVSSEWLRERFVADSSYAVKRAVLERLLLRGDTAGAEALVVALVEKDSSRSAYTMAGEVLAPLGKEQHFVFMTEGVWRFLNDYWSWRWAQIYTRYLSALDTTELARKGVDTLVALARVRPHGYVPQAVRYYLKNLNETVRVRNPELWTHIEEKLKEIHWSTQ